MSSTLSPFGIVFGFVGAFVVIVGCLSLANTGNNSSAVARPQPVQLRSVHWNPIVLRRLREQERRIWAQDDIESARREKGGWIVHQFPTPSSPVGASHQPPYQQTGFLHLPLELRIQIYSQLDYGTALRLSRSCRLIYLDHPHSHVDREQRATFLFHAETFPNNVRTGQLACYHCLQLRPRKSFRDQRWFDEFVRFGSRELERMCFACRVQNDEVSRIAAFMWRMRKSLSQANMSMRKRQNYP